jgi:uncharacterized protein (DUF1800 family)
MKKIVSICFCQGLLYSLMAMVLALAGGALSVTRAANSQVTLLSNPTSTRAIALETITMRAEPFGLTTAVRFGPDNRTRITLYGMNIGLLPGEGASAFTADLETLEGGQRKLYQALVEDVRQVPSNSAVERFDWLHQIIIRLPDNLPANVGDALVRVNWRGNGSNRVRVAIGAVGGGPADDAGSVPTPAPAVAPAATPAPTPDQFAGGTISYADAKRFLEQATFGPTEAEITRVRAMGFQAWLNEQLAKPAQPYPVPNDLPFSTELSTNMSQGGATVGCPDASFPNTIQRDMCRRNNYTAYPLQRFFLERALIGDDQLRQKSAWAMHKINVVSQRDVNVTHWMYYYLKVMDNNAYGNYRQLLVDLTLNPAMGNYLDAVNNTTLNNTPPNENYAREILQLFSIGTVKLNQDGTPVIGPDGFPVPTYDQNVVFNFAKVFTGYQFAPARFPGIVNYVNPMIITANRHDTTQKVLLDGFTLPAGQNALQDLNGAIDNIFNHPTIAPYLSKELIHAFVTSNPSPAYVKRVADVFVNNCNGLYPANPCGNTRGDMKSVYRAILLDPEARGDVKSAPNYGRLRDPLELFTNVARTFNATGFSGSGQSDGVILPLMGGAARGFLESGTYSNNPNNTTTFSPVDMETDMDIYRPVTVFSYYPSDFAAPGAPAGALGPEFGILASATALKRANFLNMLVFNGIANSVSTGLNSTPNGTKLNFAPYIALAGNPTQLIDALNQAMMHGTLPANARASIITAVTAIPAAETAKRAQVAVYLIASSSLYQVEK